MAFGRSGGFGRGFGRLGAYAGVQGIRIEFSPSAVLESATVGTAVATASIVGSYTGTPTWSLSDDAGGKFAINSSTGAVTVAAALDYETASSHSITIAVSGTTPDPSDAAATITITNVVEDTTPAAFSFTDVTDATISTLYTSNAVTISGVDGACDVVITGTASNKEYSINGGAWVSSAVTGSVVSGDTLAVRGTSSGSNSTAVTVIATVGGNVTAATADTYTITTAAGGAGAAGQPTGLLLILTKAA